jgi:hypothetical protein
MPCPYQMKPRRVRTLWEVIQEQANHENCNVIQPGNCKEMKGYVNLL